MSAHRLAGPVLVVAAAVSCAASPSVGGTPAAATVQVPAAAAAEPAAPAGPVRASADAPASTALDAAVASATTADPAVPPAPAVAPSDRWTFTSSPYVWLFDIDGSVSKGANSVPVSLHLQDSWDLVTDYGELCLAGHFEARRGDWSFFLDGNVLSFEGDMSASRSILNGTGTANADLEATLDIRQFELGAAWHAGTVELDGGCGLPIEVLGGARWNKLEVGMDLDVAAAGPRHTFERSYSPDFKTSWVDPFVGLRTRVALTESVGLILRGDVGGGLGEGSDFAWNAIALLDFRISEKVTAFAGWRWYDFERDMHDRDTNLQLEGPGIGVEILF